MSGATAGLFTAVMPIGTLIIAWLFLGETILMLQMLGMLLVIFSIILNAIQQKKPSLTCSRNLIIKSIVIQATGIVIIALIQNLIPLLIITLGLGYAFMKKKRLSLVKLLQHIRKNDWAIFFLLLGIAASLPVTLSTRQQQHYILQAYPMFTLGFTLLLEPMVKIWVNRLIVGSYRYTLLMVFSIVLLIASILIVISNVGKLGSYKDLLYDTLLVGKVIPKNSIVYLSPSLYSDSKKHSYMYRYNRISFSNKPCCQYQLWPKTEPPKSIPHYHLLHLPLRTFSLYKRSPKQQQQLGLHRILG